MLALSIRQPWAWLIATGIKDVENRRWPTHHRGVFLIHTGSQIDRAAHDWFATTTGLSVPDRKGLATGGIVGMADLVDCVTSSPSPWFSGPYGFVVKRARHLPFVAMPGKLRFFDAGDSPAWSAAAAEIESFRA